MRFRMLKPLPILLILAGCGGAEPAGAPELGRFQLPLTAEGYGGGDFRLDPARFRVTGPGTNRVVDGSDVDVLTVDLEPGDYLLRLLDDWTLNEVTGEGLVPVEAVLQSPNPQGFSIEAGEVTDIVVRFGVGDDAVAFGKGRGRIVIEVDNGDPPCEPSEEICDGIDNDCDGEVDNAPECIAEICDNSVDDDGDGFVDCDDDECSCLPQVGDTGSEGVTEGADWQVCRADAESAWIAAGSGGGTYDTTAVCQFLGYDGADLYGGNCDTVCGYCGTPGDEQYDGAGAGFPDALRTTVHFRCVNGFIPPAVGATGAAGVASGADWQVCRADAETAWISAGSGGGTYDADAACQSLGYDGADLHGGNCDTVCGYCGNAGQEEYDGAGAGWPTEYRTTVNWRCTRTL